MTSVHLPGQPIAAINAKEAGQGTYTNSDGTIRSALIGIPSVQNGVRASLLSILLDASEIRHPRLESFTFTPETQPACPKFSRHGHSHQVIASSGNHLHYGGRWCTASPWG